MTVDLQKRQWLRQESPDKRRPELGVLLDAAHKLTESDPQRPAGAMAQARQLLRERRRLVGVLGQL